MKSAYIAELTADRNITGFFLVCEKEIRTGTTGKPYLRLSLGDRTGTIEARMWEGFEETAGTLARDDFVKIQARVDLYRGKNQLIIDRLRRAEPGEIDLADYFPHTTQDVEQLYARLREISSELGNPWHRRLVLSVIEDPQMVPRLKRAPAAKTLHHAYLGGLLEHLVSLCGLCRAAAGCYPEVDADLLLAGAILHDIGKLDELSYERSFGYSTPGQLLGHIVIELELITKKIDAIEGFPPELKTLLLHLLVSHHGRLEFGSPRVPLIREAVLLHYLDDIDSKMASIRATLASPAGEGEWTAWNSSLERRLLRTDLFYRQGEDSSAKPQQLSFQPPDPSGRDE